MASCPRCKRSYADSATTCPEDGEVLLRDAYSARTDLDLKRGDTVGEYVIEGKIGSGTFGEVYRAIQPLIGKQVAIKVLSRKYSADPHIVSRFIAEARAVNQIRHKNIIDIFSFGQLSDGRHYHIMELLQGTTLHAHLQERGRLPVDECIAILQSLGRALDAAHAAGIAHRDLKPANVFLARDDDGRPFPKLLDFGIAKLLSDELPRQHQTATGAAVGTPDYMSPEQCRGPDVDHRTDIYAFGVMTYQLLTGRLPFIGENVVDVLVKQMNATPAPPSSVCPALPPELDLPILAMLEKDKDRRPPSLAAAVRALELAASSAGISITTSSTGDPVVPGARSTRSNPTLSQPLPLPLASPREGHGHASTTSPFSESVLSDTLPSAARVSAESGDTHIPPRSTDLGSSPGEHAPAPRRLPIVLVAVAAGTLAAAGLGLSLWPRAPLPAPLELGAMARPSADPRDTDQVDTGDRAAEAARRAHAGPGPGEVSDGGGADSASSEAAALAAGELEPSVDAGAAQGEEAGATIELQVTSEPRVVEVYAAGGVLLGKAPCTVRLLRGREPVTLEFRAPGYVTLTREITPLGDGELEVTLRKKGAVKPIKKKPGSDDLENPF